MTDEEAGHCIKYIETIQQQLFYIKLELEIPTPQQRKRLLRARRRLGKEFAEYQEKWRQFVKENPEWEKY